MSLSFIIILDVYPTNKGKQLGAAHSNILSTLNLLTTSSASHHHRALTLIGLSLPLTY
jgi:hypothetical protein